MAVSLAVPLVAKMGVVNLLEYQIGMLLACKKPLVSPLLPKSINNLNREYLLAILNLVAKSSVTEPL